MRMVKKGVLQGNNAIQQKSVILVSIPALADLQIVQQTYMLMMKGGVLQGNNAFQQILSLATSTTANVSALTLVKSTTASAGVDVCKQAFQRNQSCCE